MKGRDYGPGYLSFISSLQLPFLFVAKHCLSCHNEFPPDGLTSAQFLSGLVSSQQQSFIAKSCHILRSSEQINALKRENQWVSVTVRDELICHDDISDIFKWRSRFNMRSNSRSGTASPGCLVTFSRQGSEFGPPICDDVARTLRENQRKSILWTKNLQTW